jgi:hypothetical protein
MLEMFINICQESPNLVKAGQKYLALYLKAYVCFIVAGNINCSLQVKWCYALTIAKEA